MCLLEFKGVWRGAIQIPTIGSQGSTFFTLTPHPRCDRLTWEGESPTLKSDNPSGVNLAAAMQAIVQCNEEWVRQNRLNIKGKTLYFKIGPPNSGTMTIGDATLSGSEQAVEVSSVTTGFYSEKVV